MGGAVGRQECPAAADGE